MHRTIVQPGQIPLSTDLLEAQRSAYVGLGKLMEAVIGTSTALSGFNCTPTAPGSMNVLVNPGAIYSPQNVDTTPFGALASDTTHTIMKQGLLADPVQLACPAPVGAGQAINYLVQIAFATADDTPVLRTYFNSANPSLPYSGPGNSGTPDNTRRADKAIVTIKAGVAATENSQVTPTPDAGNVGSWVVKVVTGQTTISAPNITVYPGAPFFASVAARLTQEQADARYLTPGQLQAQTPVYVADTGTVNHIVIAPVPAVTGLTAGMSFKIKVANGNTGAVDVTVGALAAKALVRRDGSPLVTGDLPAGGIVDVTFDGTSFQMLGQAQPAVVNAVLTTGDQTVGGIKNFTGTLQVGGVAVWHPGNLVLGVGTSGSVPTRADADARYASIASLSGYATLASLASYATSASLAAYAQLASANFTVLQRSGHDVWTRGDLVKGIANPTDVPTRADADTRYCKVADGFAQLSGANFTTLQRGGANVYTTADFGLGVANATDVLRRSDGDGRYQRAHFVSSNQTITASGQLTIAHGLGAAPKNVGFYLVCVNANNGWNAGDKVWIGSVATSGSGYGVSMAADATNIYVQYGLNAATFVGHVKGTGATVGFTNTDWQAVFTAE